ncbi:UPF0481 protein At3g47200-like [Pistacia vera]|uniref:UPF0481 protein At3g47200-like n=1 Tax=Pistacia vera TaxID=55513 RepID=UPI001263B031|nr:UPF0481 protein At3g47200-like [Pistacia vera]
MADDHSSHPDSTEIEMPDEYGGQESVVAKTIDDQASESIATKLAHLKSTSSSRHIFKVPEHLRKGNKKAYEPYMLAIGPYHREEPQVKEMEERKKEYLKELLERTGEEYVNRSVTAMRKLEEQARSCYADDFRNIKTDDFVEMMLLDGSFIIELLRKFMFMDNTMELSSIIKKLGRDLLLIENQISFVVLEKLSSITTALEQRDKVDYNLHEMVLNFFAVSVLPSQSRVMGKSAVCFQISTEKSQHQHLLGFVHDNWLREENWEISSLVKQNCQCFVHDNWLRVENWEISSLVKQNCRFLYGHKRRPSPNGHKRRPSPNGHKRRPSPNDTFTRFMRCATELKEAGIKFKRVYRSILTDICFENGTMKMPQLEITGETESIFRNLIVYEHYFAPSDKVKLVSQYIKFMDCLINSQKDVELLCKRNILHHCLGDDATVANIFNTLNDLVNLSPINHYKDTIVSVNQYCAHRPHTWMANLRHKYFNSPWALISLFAAVLLLLFTFIQTLYSVLAYYK